MLKDLSQTLAPRCTFPPVINYGNSLGPGSLEFTIDNGLDNVTVGKMTKFVTFGARSFSLRDLDLDLVYDSGSDVERIMAQREPDVFNCPVKEGSRVPRYDRDLTSVLMVNNSLSVRNNNNCCCWSVFIMIITVAVEQTVLFLWPFNALTLCASASLTVLMVCSNSRSSCSHHSFMVVKPGPYTGGTWNSLKGSINVPFAPSLEYGGRTWLQTQKSLKEQTVSPSKRCCWSPASAGQAMW